MATFSQTDRHGIQFIHQIGNVKLYISGSVPSENKSILQKHNITHILSICKRNTYKTLNGIIYHRIGRIEDSHNYKNSIRFMKEWDTATEFIKKSESSILVHCQAGVSRSATICIAFLMKYGNMSFDEAITMVSNARPIIEPNEEIVKRLKEWNT